MAISNDILSSTLRILLDQEVDNLFKAVPVLDAMKKSGGVETYDGGQKLDVPLILAEHSQITQLSNGYEPVNLAVSDALRNATFEWCDFVAPVVITQKEELSNKGPRAIVSIAEARLKSVMGMLQREVEKQIVANNSSILSDLESLIDTAAVATNRNGFLQAGTYGTGQQGSVGGINTATFKTFNNQWNTGGTASNMQLDDMVELYIACQANTPGGGSPNLIVMDNGTYREYKGLIYNQERFMASDKLDGGRLALMFHGAQCYYDPFLDGVTVTDHVAAASKGVRAMFLNTDYLKLAFDSAAQFEMQDFEHISGYASRSANIFTRMQLYLSHLGSQGLLTYA